MQLSLIPLCAHKTDRILPIHRLRLFTDVGWSHYPPRSPDRDRCQAQEVSLRQGPKRAQAMSPIMADLVVGYGDVTAAVGLFLVILAV